MKPAESIRLLERVVELYTHQLREAPAAAQCLRELGISDASVLEEFRGGYSAGTLSGLIPAAGELREALRTSGIITESGQEALQGCIVVPVFGEDRGIAGFWGVKPAKDAGPVEILAPANACGLICSSLTREGSPLFVTDHLLDGFALWQNGFKKVAICPNADACLAQLKSIANENDVSRVCFCFGRGRVFPVNVPEFRIPVVPVQWPEGIGSAHEFFQKHTAKDLEALLPPRLNVRNSGAEQKGCLATRTPEGLDCVCAGRTYELRAIQKSGPGRLRATLRLRGEEGRFVVETLDFYNARSRRGFMSEAARVSRQPLDQVERDLGSVTEALEQYVHEAEHVGQVKPAPLDSAERTEGVKLGRARDLVGEIVKDLTAMGMAGEDKNKLLAYLVMTSRKLSDPLALLILSGSGAGKSYLQDSVLALCPEEDLVKLTSLTEQALFYRGENSLRHKVLALEESAGARGADYAIRNLISARKLVIETTVKNSVSGRLETQVNTVHGPTAVFQTTTNPHTDAETRSRFIVVSVDESPAQTRAILEKQRRLHTLEALRQQQLRQQIVRRHQAFQRLLRSLPVINPFEPLLSYPEEYLVVRRDQPKYLQLILAVAFVHQMQRPLKRDPLLGEYVEATLDDIAIANDLAHHAFGTSLADLSEPSRQLLCLIAEFMHQKAASASADKCTFSRRELREAIHWGDTRLRIHLRELVELEYVAPLGGRHGVTYRYRLLEHPNQEIGRFLVGLKSVEQLRKEASLAGISGHSAPASHLQKCEDPAGLTGPKPAACEDRGLTSHPSQGENLCTAPRDFA